MKLDLAAALGAEDEASIQRLTLYIPSRDQFGNAIRDRKKWITDAVHLLCSIGGGATTFPPVNGAWLNEQTGQIVEEETTLVYCFVKLDRFIGCLPRLRNFLHRMGRVTNQGEVSIEFDNFFFRIVSFDDK